MAFTKLLTDLNFIQKLGDNPNTDNGLTSGELKAWFDKAPLAIQEYINSVLIAELTSKFSSVDETDTGLSDQIKGLQGQIKDIVIGTGFLAVTGGTMTGSIAMSGNKITGLGTPTEAGDAATKAYAVHKTEKTASLSASGWSSLRQTVSVAGVTADNTVIVTPAPASYTACLESGVYCSGQGAGALTFACSTVPGTAVTYNILILE